MATPIVYQWEIMEYQHRPKSANWTWIVGIIGATLATVSVIRGNLLFGVFLLLATFTLILFAHKHPDKLDVEISTKGVRVNKDFFPYTRLDSYWVDDEDPEPSLILVTKERSLLPRVRIPLHPDIDPEELKDVMLDFLDEQYQPPSLTENLINYLGF